MRTVLFVLCTLAVAFGNLYSQNWDIPASRPNTRYAYDMYTIPRPALSLRGFDNQNIGAYTNAFSPKVFNQPINQLNPACSSSESPWRFVSRGDLYREEPPLYIIHKYPALDTRQ
jgi:hypothetical protein